MLLGALLMGASNFAVKELDCSCQWKVTIVGGCEDKTQGLCGVDVLLHLLNRIPGVEKAEFMDKTKQVLFTIKIGRKVNLRTIQRKLGVRWSVLAVEKYP